MTIAIILIAWFSFLGLFVALKARQPKLEYPKPPKSRKIYTTAA